MKKLSQILFSILIIFFTNFSVVFSAQWKINLISGKAKIIDGDTIKINGNNIRLLGIDAPEKNQICFKKGESYNCGTSSTKALKKYVGKKILKCIYFEKDKYGRILLEGKLIVDQNFTFTYAKDDYSTSTETPAQSVSNYTYEQRLNEEKRKIRVLKPTLLPAFITDFRNIMSYDKSSSFINKSLISSYNPRESGV